MQQVFRLTPLCFLWEQHPTVGLLKINSMTDFRPDRGKGDYGGGTACDSNAILYSPDTVHRRTGHCIQSRPFFRSVCSMLIIAVLCGVSNSQPSSKVRYRSVCDYCSVKYINAVLYGK